MLFMCREAQLTFWHVNLTSYTWIWGAHTSASLSDCSGCEGMGHINSSHVSERRCSDKNALLAGRFKTCAAKTISVLRSSAFMPKLRKRKKGKKCLWYNQKQNNLWFLESSAKQALHKCESLLLREKRWERKNIFQMSSYILTFGIVFKKFFQYLGHKKTGFMFDVLNKHGFSAIPRWF